jgi:hypothetical protein
MQKQHYRKLSSEKGMRTSPTKSEGYAIPNVDDYGLKEWIMFYE